MPFWTHRLYSLRGQRGERYTAGEAARALGVSVPTVLRWIDRGWLTASRPRPGVVAIRRAAIRRALKRLEVQQTVASAKRRERGARKADAGDVANVAPTPLAPPLAETQPEPTPTRLGSANRDDGTHCGFGESDNGK